MPQNLLLIDLSSIAHPLFHISASDPDPNATSTKTVERVRALASGQPHVAVCCDSGRSFRKDVSTDYKANRPESDATLQHQIALAVDILKADGFPTWSVANFEADDLIATGVERSRGLQDLTVTIASADKDLLQLVSDRVSIKSLKDGNLIGPDEVKAKFGVAPNQIRDYLSLVGDSSDNVKGATGIGAKRAVDLLNAYGNLEDMFKALDEHPSSFTDGMIANLREFQPRLPIVRELITLRTDVPLPFDEIFKERVPVDVAVFGDGSMSELQYAQECGPESLEPAHERREALDEPRRHAPVAEATPEAPASEAALPRDTDQTRRAGVVAENRVASVGQCHEGAPTRAVAGEQRRNVIQTAYSAFGQQPDVLNQPRPMGSGIDLTVHAPGVISATSIEWERQLEPRSMNEAKQVAADLFASRMFSAYGNASAVLSTIMAGREMGFQTMASLRAFHIIDGKPSLSAGAIHSLVLTSGKAKYFRCVERTAERATFETQRGEDPPMALSFTLTEARQAWGKDQKAWDASGWGKSPSDMLVARAITKLARLVYPDVCHGLYSPEELGS